MNEVKIYTAQDNIQAEMVRTALENNGIPSLKKDIGSGGIMNIYGGNSTFGEDIYIAPSNVPKAEEILQDMGLLEE